MQRGGIKDRKESSEREKLACRSKKGSDSKGLEGQQTERVRKVDSLARYSIINRLRAALELGLSQPGSSEAAIVCEQVGASRKSWFW
jgi:hypothetical protein